MPELEPTPGLLAAARRAVVQEWAWNPYLDILIEEGYAAREVCRNYWRLTPAVGRGSTNMRRSYDRPDRRRG